MLATAEAVVSLQVIPFFYVFALQILTRICNWQHNSYILNSTMYIETRLVTVASLNDVDPHLYVETRLSTEQCHFRS